MSRYHRSIIFYTSLHGTELILQRFVSEAPLSEITQSIDYSWYNRLLARSIGPVSATSSIILFFPCWLIEKNYCDSLMILSNGVFISQGCIGWREGPIDRGLRALETLSPPPKLRRVVGLIWKTIIFSVSWNNYVYVYALPVVFILV